MDKVPTEADGKRSLCIRKCLPLGEGGEWDGWKENKRDRSKANKILTSTVW